MYLNLFGLVDPLQQQANRICAARVDEDIVSSLRFYQGSYRPTPRDPICCWVGENLRDKRRMRETGTVCQKIYQVALFTYSSLNFQADYRCPTRPDQGRD